MNCQQCGKEMPENEQICSNCGAVMGTAQQPNPMQQPEQQQNGFNYQYSQQQFNNQQFNNQYNPYQTNMNGYYNQQPNQQQFMNFQYNSLNSFSEEVKSCWILSIVAIIAVFIWGVVGLVLAVVSLVKLGKLNVPDNFNFSMGPEQVAYGKALSRMKIAKIIDVVAIVVYAVVTIATVLMVMSFMFSASAYTVF